MHWLNRMKSEQSWITVSNYPDFMSVSIHFFQVTIFNGPEPIHVLELCLLRRPHTQHRKPPHFLFFLTQFLTEYLLFRINVRPSDISG
jgi:hypothetical protein